jgi:transcriptional regulator with XRE-family HTH domain
VTSCSPAYDRVVERRRAVALVRHLREAEGLSVAQIAERLGLAGDDRGVSLQSNRR